MCASLNFLPPKATIRQTNIKLNPINTGRQPMQSSPVLSPAILFSIHNYKWGVFVCRIRVWLRIVLLWEVFWTVQRCSCYHRNRRDIVKHWAAPWVLLKPTMVWFLGRDSFFGTSLSYLQFWGKCEHRLSTQLQRQVDTVRKELSWFILTFTA